MQGKPVFLGAIALGAGAVVGAGLLLGVGTGKTTMRSEAQADFALFGIRIDDKRADLEKQGLLKECSQDDDEVRCGVRLRDVKMQSLAPWVDFRNGVVTGVYIAFPDREFGVPLERATHRLKTIWRSAEDAFVSHYGIADYVSYFPYQETADTNWVSTHVWTNGSQSLTLRRTYRYEDDSTREFLMPLGMGRSEPLSITLTAEPLSKRNLDWGAAYRNTVQGVFRSITENSLEERP